MAVTHLHLFPAFQEMIIMIHLIYFKKYKSSASVLLLLFSDNYTVEGHK